MCGSGAGEEQAQAGQARGSSDARDDDDSKNIIQ